MARVMLAWELGGGLGHLTAAARLALALVDRGHQVDLVAKDLSLAEQALGARTGDRGLRLWQAPVWLPALAGLPEPASHAEMMFRAGYLDPGRLLGLVRGWRSLLNSGRPDLLLADHAPTALLAARGLPIKTALFGSAFSVPPARSPLPAFRDWENVPPERIAAADRRVLQTCNACLQTLGSPPLPTLHELYRTDDGLLLGWPELDPYRDARDSEALLPWGQFAATPAAGARPVRWHPVHRPRVLGYLQSNYPGLARLLEALRRGPGHTVVHLAGLSDTDAEALGNEHLQVEASALNLGDGLQQAEVWLGHGGSASTHEALGAGVPAVLLPMQAEQLLTARRVAAAGAGRFLWPEEAPSGIGEAIATVATGDGFRAAARALAARHAGDALPAVAARCEWLLSGSPVR